MKNSSIILLLFLVLFASFKDGVLYLGFKMKQAEIIEKWCINKEKPKLKCNGKCFLKKKIVESKEQQQKDTAPPTVFQQFKQIVCYLTYDLNISPLVFVHQQKNVVDKKFFIPQPYIKDIFHPPKYLV